MRQIITVLMENEPGSLSRVVGLFSARGYNIESLNVAPTQNPKLSRLTVTLQGTPEEIEQLTKQLHRLVDVLKVMQLTDQPHLERELMLVKVRFEQRDSEEVKRLADIFRGKVVDVTDKTYAIEITGGTQKLEAFLEAVRAIGRVSVLETARTGLVCVSRGSKVLGPQ